jgi:hypothetical protein
LKPKKEGNAWETPEFSANKKWAVSPLISPPAGADTANLADKLVCILSISQNAGKFNGEKSREQGTAISAAIGEAPLKRRMVGCRPIDLRKAKENRS